MSDITDSCDVPSAPGAAIEVVPSNGNVARTTCRGTVQVLDSIQSSIEHATHFLPSQGPLTAFVHHNTLHAFEELPFEKAVVEGGKLFGCQPFLREDAYREMLSSERIRSADLRAVLEEELGAAAHASIAGLGTRIHMRLAMLQHPLPSGPEVELRWFLAQSDSLRRFRPDVPIAQRDRFIEETRHWVMRDLRNGRHESVASTESLGPTARGSLADLFDEYGEGTIERWSDATWEAFTLQSLWRACEHGVRINERPAASPPKTLRHRDALLKATSEDSDLLVNEVLIPFCSAFLDQGFADWRLPSRNDGFYRAFLELHGRSAGPPRSWMRGLKRDIDRLLASQIGPLESIRESLELLGVDETELEAFLPATLLALRGWAGMVWQMETRSDRAVIGAPAGSLVEFVAVRLLLERHALAHIARHSLRHGGRLCEVREAADAAVATPEGARVQRHFHVFHLAQILGWRPRDLFELTEPKWSQMLDEIDAFSEIERRRVFHLAYEREFYIRTLDAFAARAGDIEAPEPVEPDFQVICCIDEREESFRRHLEEVAPHAQTYSAAGFFGVAMYYRGAADAHFLPLCPVVVRPQHWVQETAVYTFADSHRRRAQTRRMLGAASHQVHVRSRTFAGGALLSTLFGPLATVPLVARVLFPRLTARLRRLAGRLVQTPTVTQLQLERTHHTPGPTGDQVGYSVAEMAGIVERLLRDIGLTSSFARLVIVTGHGSSSLNNPHESAHDCGACAGARGGPNARAFALMANDPRVRAIVAGNALAIPASTVFVGAYHNTCDDSVTYFDLDRLPSTCQAAFDEARRAIDLARERSGHERCRRFESAPLSLSTESGLRHVEGRAEDLAQTRPEYGHATNAVTYVGRRRRTRGLYLDRRAFLTSYDPTQDDAESSILTRILQAVIPVCAGISLEYYFSFVDPVGYGCGTKLPHNITSLLGVMDGPSSDLRTGLPWQMVEIHEPVRELFIIEAAPEAVLSIIERNPGIARLCKGGWIRLAVLNPDAAELLIYQYDGFHLYFPESTDLPRASSSIDWYRGWRGHLGYALIGPDGRSSPEPQPRASTRAG